MSVETTFRTLLAAHAPLVALVGTRIAHEVMPVGAPTPFVVFTAGHDFSHNLLGEVMADACTLSVQCWAKTSAQAEAVADAAVAAVATAPGDAGATVITRTGGYDEETDLHATVLTVEWWA